MEVVVTIFPQTEWPRINRLRHFKRVYFMSQLLASDGTTVRQASMGTGEGTNSQMLFPHQEPTMADIRYWEGVIKHMTSPKLRWSPPLGRHLRQPYDTDWWWTTGEGGDIYLANTGTLSSTKYARVPEGLTTRRRVAYRKTDEVIPTPMYGFRECTVEGQANKEVRIQSVARHITQIPSPPGRKPNQNMSIKDLFVTLGGGLGRDLHLGSDEGWLVTAYTEGTLVLVHDGSYQPALAADVCSAGLVIFCTSTGQLGTVTAAEKTSPSLPATSEQKA
jgi:hypothetical protein